MKKDELHARVLYLYQILKLFMLERKYHFSTLSTMLIKTGCCDTMESRISLARTR